MVPAVEKQCFLQLERTTLPSQINKTGQFSNSKELLQLTWRENGDQPLALSLFLGFPHSPHFLKADTNNTNFRSNLYFMEL